MITDDGLDLICGVLANHLNSIDDPEYKAKIDRLEKEAMIEFMERHPLFRAAVNSASSSDFKNYNVVNGVGVLKLTGPIFPRANLMTRMSGATALEEYTQYFSDALDDDDVQALIQVVDSPGGSVSGGFEMASKVFGARAQSKPVLTLVEGTCASLAYLIGSQSDMVYTTEASMTGSIGVVMAIEDDTRAAENEGIKRTVLKTGKNKAIGVGPVTDDQIAELKSMMGDYFDRFKAAVVRARTGVDIEKVSDGSLWIGQKAVNMGLVDGVSTLDDLISEYRQ